MMTEPRRTPAILVCSLVLLLAPLYYVALRNKAVSVYHDDGLLLVTAKALAEGRGYRIVSLPDEIPQTKYPIGFPALLSVVWRVCPSYPENVPFLKLVPFAFSVLWLGAAYRYAKESTGRSDVALGVVLLAGVSPWVLFVSTNLLTESAFGFFLTASLLFVRRAEEGTSHSGWRPALTAGILAGGAFLMRTAALPLLIAGPVSLAAHKRYRCAAAMAGASMALALPWLAWQMAHNSPDPVYQWYTSGVYRTWNLLTSFTSPQKAGILGGNLLYLVVSPVSLFGLPLWLPSSLAVLGFVVFFVAGAVGTAWRRPKAVHIFLALYLAMILCWAWNPVRFLVPLLPLLLLVTYFGGAKSTQWLNLGTAARVALAVSLVSCAAASGAVSSFRSTLRSLEDGALYPPYIGRVNWRQMDKAYRWMSANLPPESIVVADVDPAVYLNTGRKALRAFSADSYLLYYSSDWKSALGSSEQLLARLDKHKVTHILLIPTELFRESLVLADLVQQLRTNHEGLLERVQISGPPGCELYVVNRSMLVESSAPFKLL